MVVVMVLCPCHSIVLHDATVPVVMALLAWWWFASCPVRHELAVAFVIIFRPSGGISTGVGSRSLIIDYPAGHETSGHDPELRGRGRRWHGRP